MSKRFEQYNFTRESEVEEIRERNRQLEEENHMLKRSLEELIKVNTELTESIEEFNNNNYQEGNEELERRFEMLLNQNQKLKKEIDDQEKQHQENYQNQQTESLVNVLEELIDSFKNIQLRYQNEIKELQDQIQNSKASFENVIKKLEQQLLSKISTVDALANQLKRKDELLVSIEEKVKMVEKNGMLKSNSSMKNEGEDIKLMAKMEKVKLELQQKNRVIKVYEKLIGSLKVKIMEKY